MPLSVGRWLGFSEALASLIGAWLLIAMLRGQSGSTALAQRVFGLACIVFGLSHFVYGEFTASMIPGWLPAHLILAYLTGAGHMAAGVALVTGAMPRLAATLEALMLS